MTTARILGLLPARGGSKGIPGKNLRLLGGRPLLAWAAAALVRSASPVRRICSTDDPKIADAALAAGLELAWPRPPELAQDETLVVDVVAHALRTLAAAGDEPYRYVVLVQATSPFVSPEDIDGAVRLALDTDADTVVTAYEAGQQHPAVMFRLSEGGTVRWLLDAPERMARRQDLDPVYVRTGLVYVVRASLVLRERTLYGREIRALLVPRARALTIDEPVDFQLAEFLAEGSHNV